MRQLTEKFLLDLLRSDSENDFRKTLAAFEKRAHEIDWPPLLGRGFKIFLPVYLEIKSFSKNFKIPPEIESTIQTKYISTVGKNEKIRQAMTTLAQEFNRAKVDLIFLKGAALLTTVYKNDIGLRPMEDIDVLVRQKDLSRAEDILRALGYVEAYEEVSKEAGIELSRDFFSRRHFHYIYIKNGIRLEVHWDITYKKTAQSLLNRLFESAEKAKMQEIEISTLSAEANIFIACLNFIKDLDSVVPKDWFKSEDKTEKIFYYTLSLLHEIKKILQHDEAMVSWDNLLFFVRSTKTEYEVLTLLFLAKKIVAADLGQIIIRKMRRHAFVNLYIYRCGNIAYDDLTKLILTRNLIGGLRPKPVRGAYDSIAPYLAVYHPAVYFITERAATGIRFLMRWARRRLSWLDASYKAMGAKS